MIFIDDSEQEPDKIIYIQRNGDHNSKKTCKVMLKSGITFLDIQIKVQKDLQLGYVEKLRLFNREGVEIFENDLQFLQNNYNLLASKGEDYDSSTGFSEYQMLKVIGEGGFGKVVLAEHKVTKEKVAIKFVNSSLIGNASDIDMVFREAEVLKNLQHRNIVKIYNCYTLKGMEVVFIMEYLKGGELLEYITKKGKLSEFEARQFFRQMVDAIQYCHKENVIHRDLKLENILLLQSNSLTIKIIDFGIAGVGNLNTNKLNVGSLRYMAPEVLLKQVQSLQKSIDIWSLGIILFTLVIGQLPFNGEHPQEVIKKITSGNYSIPYQMENLLTEEIKDLIANILIVDPINRFTIKQIIQHDWMKLPAGYLQDFNEMIQQIQTGREMTMRGITGGISQKQNLYGDNTSSINVTKEVTKSFGKSNQSLSPLKQSPLVDQRLNMLKESTMMRISITQKFGKPGQRENSLGLKEATKQLGSKSPVSTPIKTAFAQKKQLNQNLDVTTLDVNRYQDLLDDQKESEDYFSKQNVVEEQINEIKKVLGLQVAPFKSFHKITSNTNIQNQSILPQIQLTNTSSIIQTQEKIEQNGIKIVKRGGSKELNGSLEKSQVEKQNELQVNALNRVIQSSNQEKRTSIETGIVLKNDANNENDQKQKNVQNKEQSPSSQELPQSKNDILESQEKKLEQINQENKQKEMTYYRLVYIMRQRYLTYFHNIINRKQEEQQGDPHLQINKDYGGIYIPKEVGYVKYTANTNLRSAVVSPMHYAIRSNKFSMRKKSFSPKRKEQQDQPNNEVFSPQNIFLKRPTSLKNVKSKLNISYN